MGRATILFALMVSGLCAVAGSAPAQEAAISPDRQQVSFSRNGTQIAISRSAADACPPACIQPLTLAPDIRTYGELEVLAFLETAVAGGTALLVDLRAPEAYAAGTIPGAVNIPEQTLRADNPYLSDLLAALGLTDPAAQPSFDLVLFADSASAPTPAVAIEALRSSGYPASKLGYYRAGVRGWAALGLSTAPEE